MASPVCPLTPSSHANHARFSACWLSYETPREHGALRDGRGNKDSVAVNSTSPRALNIVYVAPAASAGRRRGAASLLYAFLFFFSSSIQLVFGEITVASCSPRLPHFLRHTTEPPPAYFLPLRFLLLVWTPDEKHRKLSSSPAHGRFLLRIRIFFLSVVKPLKKSASLHTLCVVP